jgi:hypothetical protein
MCFNRDETNDTEWYTCRREHESSESIGRGVKHLSDAGR